MSNERIAENIDCSGVECVNFDSEGIQMVAGTNNGQVHVYDIRYLKKLHTI